MKKSSDVPATPSSNHSPEEIVRKTAYEIEFSLVGITDLTPTSRSKIVFDRWIRDGRHGDMRYLSAGADKRHNPALLLDGAKSVICVGVNYYSEAKERRNRNAARHGNGMVAIYAHGGDYHSVMREMLEELDRRLKESFPKMTSQIAVDTQPISERDMALKSGIAWLGKNTCVISPEFGSWIFLGELITDLPLETDKPLESLCGSCTKCIDACPTGALDEPFLIDARKCISYLTIEKRGDIPEYLHKPIGLNLFGCDACQQVCPFNESARESSVFDDRQQSPILDRSLEDLVEIGDGEFKRLTRDSAISRCKAEGMRRNAGIVAKNLCNDLSRD
ncbi:MAG: tRNA epoxyqueuosine(34) reductase QueG [Candidatus Latescibacterota bacterium]|nr:MAG: tRNA epoxyqueuosine(34) reductase QueG [Candidatus Latescibacterota bacterium]